MKIDKFKVKWSLILATICTVFLLIPPSVRNNLTPSTILIYCGGFIILFVAVYINLTLIEIRQENKKENDFN